MVGRRPAIVTRRIGLALALLSGGWLVLSGPVGAGPPSAAVPAPPSVGQVWPRAVMADVSGVLSDGASYVPALYAGGTTTVGVAVTADRAAVRVVLRAGDRERELRRVQQTSFPRFVGFIASDGEVFWAESTATLQQPLTHSLWRASLHDDAPASLLTTDTGAAVLQDAANDLVVHDGRLYWAAMSPDGVNTQVRSVPVAGGAVDVASVDGAYELSAWPWLQTAANVRQGGGRQELRNLVSGARITIVKAAAETVDCSPVWCRSIVSPGAGADSSFDVMRVDGTGRRRVGGAGSVPAVAGVALLDRFEVVLQRATGPGFDAAARLVLCDVTSGRLLSVAEDVDQVRAAGHWLWWSTGDRPAKAWHALDLSAPGV